MAGFYVSAHKMYCPNGRAKETIETKSTTTTKERGGGEGRQTDRQTDRHRERERDKGGGGERVIKLSMKFVHAGCVIHAAFVTTLAWRCVTKSNQGSQVVGGRSLSTS